MARSAVLISLGTESLGQQSLNTDHVSGLVLYGTAPGSFATNPYQAVYSVADAENKGITNDYSDETVPRAIVTISGTPAEGETLTLVVTEKNPITAANPTGTTTVTLGTGTAPATPTVTSYAAAVVAAINALTYSHGYSATNSSGVITVIGRAGLGISLNPAVSTTPLAISSTGSGSSYAITQQFGTGSGGATAGVYSKKALWHYQISRFFAMNPTGKLWVGFFSSVSATFADIVTLANAAEGEINQTGLYDITATNAATVTSNGTLMQARAVELRAAYIPQGSILYAPNIKAISDLSTLQNQQTVSNYYVTTVLQQDGEALGAQLFINSGVSVQDLGGALGRESAVAVNVNVGEIATGNLSDGTEMAVPAFANGTKVKAVASSLLDQLDAYRYMFATTIPGKTGTYINNDWSNILQTSPYYRISRNRVMSKAIRLTYSVLVELLKSQIQLNPDGTITKVTQETFTGAILPVATQMKENNEISNMSVTIDPAQNVLSTGTIIVGVGIQPTVSADFIQENIAFKAKL